jgi:hypothetical protein
MAGIGGKRPGAGRKRGARNKVTFAREAELAASGLTPLDYMLSILRDPEASREDRKWASEKAAPYCHHRLSTTEVTGNLGIVMQEDALDALKWDEQRTLQVLG